MILSQQPFYGPVKPICFGDEQIKLVTTTQALVVTIDNRLTWKEQHRKVIKSFSAKLSQLKRIKYLPRYALEEIYHKAIIPNVTYGILVWGTCSPSLMDENHHVRAAKMIYNIRQDNLTNEQILEQVDWKPLGDIYKKRILTLMHDVYYMTVPQDLQNLFTRTARVGRRKQNFNVVRCKTEKGRTSLRYRGPIAWNQLDNDTKAIANKIAFKTKIRNSTNLDSIHFLKEAVVNNNKNTKDFKYFKIGMIL
jgi:hypothetical protein